MKLSTPHSSVPLVIIGAGAAGLMAGIVAARAMPPGSVVLLDGARKLGAKILVAGGGRCNVTHDLVDESAYAGSSRHAIRKVLRRFDVSETIAFFEQIGVTLKREETGKLFPITDSARTVLDALIGAAQDAGANIQHPCRIETVKRLEDGGFGLSGDWGSLHARRVILATGGMSLPKSGSDGGGYALALALGHTITPRVFPALVPLTLPRDHFLCSLSGIALPTALDVRAPNGKRIVGFTDSTLLTHFGLSGPAPLNVSRYYTDARRDDPAATLTVNWLPDLSEESVDADLRTLGRGSIGRWLTARLPERLARALLNQTAIAFGATGDTLTREVRRTLTITLTRFPLPITGDRGFTYAEVTAGGVPLSEIRLETMESRICAGLFLCGELCDVDGKIGGYNFQWAWASGFVAGTSAAC